MRTCPALSALSLLLVIAALARCGPVDDRSAGRALGKGDGAGRALLSLGAADIAPHAELARGLVAASAYRQLFDRLLREVSSDQTSSDSSATFDRLYQISSLDGLRLAFERAHPDQPLTLLPVTQAAGRLAAFAFDHSRVVVPERTLRVELLIQRMIEQPASWREELSGAAPALSFDEKLAVIARAGGLWGARYNFERAAQVLGAEGFVSTEQLWASVRDNTPGGVCRDVARGQAELAVAAGIDQAYAVAFATSGGQFHVTTLLQDPTDSTRVIKLNYDEVTIDRGLPSGAGNLHQDTSLPDYGINFRVYGPSGSPVTQLPSALQQTLSLAMALDAEGLIEPGLVQRDGPVLESQLEAVAADGQRSARVLHGLTSRGETVLVAGTRHRLSVGPGTELRLGIAVFSRRGERRVVDFDQTGLSSRVDVQLDLGRGTTQLADGSQLSAAASVALSLQLMAALVEESHAWSDRPSRFVAGDFYQDSAARLQLAWRSADGDTTAELAAETHLYVDVNNVAAMLSHGVRLVHDRTDLRLVVDHVLASDLVLSASAGLSLRERLGDVFFIRGGLLLGEPSGGNVTIDFGLQGSLGTPTHFLPGSDYALDVGVDYAANEAMNIRLDLLRNLVTGRTTLKLEVPIRLR